MGHKKHGHCFHPMQEWRLPLDLRQSGGHHSWEGFPTDRGVADSSNDDSRRGGQQVTVAQSIIYVLFIM